MCTFKTMLKVKKKKKEKREKSGVIKQLLHLRVPSELYDKRVAICELKFTFQEHSKTSGGFFVANR